VLIYLHCGMGGARYLWRHNLNYVGAGAAHCGSQRSSRRRDAPRGYTPCAKWKPLRLRYEAPPQSESGQFPRHKLV